jgi:hypothetical protein
VAGHASGDDCPDSIATYRRAIDDMTQRIDELEARRSALVALLDSAESAESAESAAAQAVPRCEFSAQSGTEFTAQFNREDTHA